MVDTKQLHQKIEALPDNLLSQVADYIDFLMDRNNISIHYEIPDWQIKETEKRLQQIKSGEMELIPWEKAKKDIFKK